MKVNAVRKEFVETRMLTGLVQLDGKALTGSRVLLISGDTTTFLGSTTTSEDGAFEIAVPAEHQHGRVVLLLKIQGPVVGLLHRAIDLRNNGSEQQDFQLNTSSPAFHTLNGKVISTSGWPPYLNVLIDPVHVEGVPEPLEKFFRWQDERIVESTFFKMRVDGDTFNLRVMPGTYKIAAHHLNYFRPTLTNPDFDNYIASKAEADAESQSLPGDRDSGFVLEVKRDRQVVFSIDVVPDEELSSSNA